MCAEAFSAVLSSLFYATSSGYIVVWVSVMIPEISYTAFYRTAWLGGLSVTALPFMDVSFNEASYKPPMAGEVSVRPSR